MIRLIDFLLAVLGLIFLFPVIVIVAITGYFDTGSPIFIQTRVGRNKKPFKLIKFRTMKIDTESVASHLANKESITFFGKILRKTKLDELPQLINVVKGDMSLVGPRPNLFNQEELIKARDELNIYDSLPGITGLAQVYNIDMSTPKKLAEMDREMLDTLSTKNYFRYIFMTLKGMGSGDAVKNRGDE
ncbi:sugar transferase [Salinivibrio proteolyticus]|uniref:Sugar transferase n=1 Tax=Salinivibrio proteolyticus TaxID=334715 RepID=A0ABY7L9N9_9GAMM|nr:sugar transferase [Salinivibrio proteolyticus]WBA13970.1 sugar transferase [Salinivibrio proteolyticus]